MDAETFKERRFPQDFLWNDGLSDFVSMSAPGTHGTSLSRGPVLDKLPSMDEEGRVGVRRRLICDHAALKLLKAIAERDAAILERNSAIAEKKAACVERDAALLRCDLAFSQRDSAIVERDAAVAALGAVRAGKIGTFNEWTRHASPNAVASKVMQPPIVTDSTAFGVDFGAAATCQWKSSMGRSNIGSEVLQKQSLAGSVKANQRDLRSKRKICKDSKHGFLPSRKRPPEQKLIVYQRETLDQTERGSSVTEEVADDNICNSIPYCSCTGVNQPCYKWGNGGWQSACCTTMISMYPLPMNPKKRSSRLAGRKMSAGAFEKLVDKLSLEGVNVKCPIDLKDHWAKHGTNRYVTLR